MRLRHIEIFNAVMLTGSISAAARLINVTQPAVSRTLKHAELQLGFTLFERAAGRLVPTTEAQALFPLVEKLFLDLDEVRRLASNLRVSSQTRELKILTVLAMSQSIFPKAVALFKRKFLDISLHHQALHSPQIIDSLVLQEADVGYLFGACSHPALNHQSLQDVPIYCVAPKGMLDRAVTQLGHISPEYLHHLPIISLDSRDPVGRTIADLITPEESLQERYSIVVQTHHVALAMAHEGLGVALVEGCTAACADSRLVDVVALRPAVNIPVLAAWSSARPTHLAARAFTQCMQQALTSNLP